MDDIDGEIYYSVDNYYGDETNICSTKSKRVVLSSGITETYDGDVGGDILGLCR